MDDRAKDVHLVMHSNEESEGQVGGEGGMRARVWVRVRVRVCVRVRVRVSVGVRVSVV